MTTFNKLTALAATAFLAVSCGGEPAKDSAANPPPATDATGADVKAAPAPVTPPKADAPKPAAAPEKPKVDAPPAEPAAPSAQATPAPAPAPAVPAPAAPAAPPAPAVASADAAAGPGGGNWARWGRDGHNNMSSSATGIPDDINPGTMNDKEEIDLATGKHLKWVAKLGSHAYGTPTIEGGRVFVGTNNEVPRNPNATGDRGIMMAFDEATGKYLWQLAVPKLGAGKVSDWEYLGICSSAQIEGKYAYVVTNRGEILCLDVYGMEDGNDGPFQDEAKYIEGGLDGMANAKPVEIGPGDADIIWGYDMRGELGVFPHNVTSSSVVIAGDKVFASTSNGVDWSHLNLPAPQAPCIIALNKETGALVGEEASGIGKNIMHCNWSSPGYAELNGVKTVLFGAGDSFAYGFGMETTKDAEGFDVLKELWKVDCCPKEYRFDAKGEPIKYATYPGPSEIIASPVTYNNKVYVAIGQDPEHGEGVGCLTCIDPSKGNGQDAIVWQFKNLGRTISTPSIVDGLIYISDYSGKVFCIDAETGKEYWFHDTLSHIWGSTMVVDGKVLIGNEDGELIILAAGKEKKELSTVEFPSPIFSTPIVANGTLYIMTETHLYAFQK